MQSKSALSPHSDDTSDAPARQRILEAAFSAFRESGYSGTSTLEIATRARVSKRELYALVGNKGELLAACISARAKRLQMPTDLPAPRNRKMLGQTLNTAGVRLLKEISEPAVIGVFRLAIAEAVRAPQVAQTLDTMGRETSRATLRGIMDQARSAGLVDGEPSKMAEQFYGLLWGNLMLSLLLGVTERPSPAEMTDRARDATDAFLQLYPGPSDPGRSAGRRRS
jgi:AcrR family transcriptional regulator